MEIDGLLLMNIVFWGGIAYCWLLILMPTPEERRKREFKRVRRVKRLANSYRR